MGECKCDCQLCDRGDHQWCHSGDCKWNEPDEVIETVPTPDVSGLESIAWEPWRSFPDPRKGQFLNAPLGPGVYWLRDSRNRLCIYIGGVVSVASTMSSLLPAPFARDTRDNAALRRYILENLEHIVYRTVSCDSKSDAQAIERLLRLANECRF